MTPLIKRLVIVGLICVVVVTMFLPLETTVVPQWRLQVVDVNEIACPNMRVTQSWAHYSLYLGGDFQSANRLTDANGYVEFPRRTVRAALPRRIVVPIIAHILLIAHGSVGADGAVWATGIKDVAWLSYKSGKPLPNKMRVERCYNDGTEQIGRERQKRDSQLDSSGDA